MRSAEEQGWECELVTFGAVPSLSRVQLCLHIVLHVPGYWSHFHVACSVSLPYYSFSPWFSGRCHTDPAAVYFLLWNCCFIVFCRCFLSFLLSVRTTALCFCFLQWRHPVNERQRWCPNCQLTKFCQRRRLMRNYCNVTDCKRRELDCKRSETRSETARVRWHLILSVKLVSVWFEPHTVSSDISYRKLRCLLL